MFDLLILASSFVHSVSAQNFISGAETAREFGVHEIVLTGHADVPNLFETDCAMTFEPVSCRTNAVTV
jgi:hypothetical protein